MSFVYPYLTQVGERKPFIEYTQLSCATGQSSICTSAKKAQGEGVRYRVCRFYLTPLDFLDRFIWLSVLECPGIHGQLGQHRAQPDFLRAEMV